MVRSGAKSLRYSRMTVNLLVDADIPAYQIAARCEQSFDFDGDIAVNLTPEKIGPMVDEELNACADAVGADRIYVCLSDPASPGYFRRELEPTYKTNRAGTKKPELLQAVKNYMSEEYPYYVRPRLEADDIMGILATHPKLLPGKNIMCSADKDMRTIPGFLYNPNKADLGVLDISVLDANRFLLWQAIVGDATDGYKGVPGIGDKSPFAEEIIGATSPEELWNIVLEAYSFKGLTEDDAILQVRMARILRSCDYNFKTHKIKLWNPTKLYWDQ
jgi:Autographiviridae exonuclease